MKSEIVIAAYKPKSGKSADFKVLLKKHIPTLRELELITDRAEIIMTAKDGSFLEIFEWRSAEAMANAHEHPAVAKIWEAMAKIADFTNLAALEECSKSFPHFAPVVL